MRKYRQYTNDQIKQGAKESVSIAGLLRKLELKPCGGNYVNIKRRLQELNVDCTHWTGQAWSAGQRLKDWSNYTRAVNIKQHIIEEKGHRCESCKMSEWKGKPIPLEIHHKNGDRSDNRYSNLELNCCNCHAQTDYWRNKKRL